MRIKIEIFSTEARPLREPKDGRTTYTVAQVKIEDEDGITAGAIALSDDLLKEQGGIVKPGVYDALIRLQPDGFRTQVVVRSLTPVKAASTAQPLRAAAGA